jgi:lipoprotein-anchoring transpeptidase ErfK/SrfK
VTVRYKGRRFRLTATQAKVGIDLDGSVDRALAKSREGGILARTFRDVRGKRVDAEVPVSVDHSEAAIKRLVARVGKALSKPAKDAEVSITAAGVSRTPSRDGRALRANALRREVRARLLSLSGPRVVRAHTRVVRPKVTTEGVADKYPAIVMVDRSNFRLTLYKKLKLAETYGIAVGKVGLETPAGRYTIQNKAVDPAWHVPNSDWAGELAGRIIPGGVPENPIKARWLGVYDGVGIHGTGDESSIGSNASHGCIRMRVRDVKRLYDEVPVGAPIYIA